LKFSCEPPKPTRWLKVPNEPPSTVAVTLGGPEPCLVVIEMTPPIASEPYRPLCGPRSVDAVDQDFDVIGIGPANEHRRLAAGSAGLDDVEARHDRQRVRNGAVLMALDVG
jgi:hypothetical protein